MTDTICAISTALGFGAISIIRVSGNEAINIVNSLFKGKNLENSESHTIHYGFIVDKDTTIDEVLVSVMKAPKTFTTEDTIEINCHGGIASTNKVLELLIRNGCRLAEGGEFTKRAFLNGRIDLLEAEGIEDLIKAETDKERQMALNQVQGHLSNIIKSLKEVITNLRANIEVNIDYPEYEDEVQITHQLLKEKSEEISDKLNLILKEAENGKLIKNGIKVALVGKPNVGKSSILNKLIQEEKAIVTDIAGTTRDVVEGKITLNGIILNIFDTAGIRKTTSIVEKIGVNKSLETAKNADLIIYVLSNEEELTKEDIEFINKIQTKTHIIMINKTDLERKINLTKITSSNIIEGSTKTPEGLEKLKTKIIELFNLEELESQDFTYLSNARQIALVKQAIEYMDNVHEQIKNNIPIDVIAIDIENCWNVLGEIIGETYQDELLDVLFSNFCLGK